MLSYLRKRWRERIIRRNPLPLEDWHRLLRDAALFAGLSADEQRTLHDQVVWFLYEKSIFGTGEYQVSDWMRLVIAAQACLPILNLDADSYADWHTIVVYPTPFVTRDPVRDAIGLVHEDQRLLSGQARHDGPVLLSWPDSRRALAGEGWNVVIHEMAHKLDMLNGSANGFPPLHAGMHETDWTRAFKHAYLDLCKKVDAGEHHGIDAYGAENPAEFFAVVSETFFEAPEKLVHCYPEVYRQLALFYRQDALSRRQVPHALAAISG